MINKFYYSNSKRGISSGYCTRFKVRSSKLLQSSTLWISNAAKHSSAQLACRTWQSRLPKIGENDWSNSSAANFWWLRVHRQQVISRTASAFRHSLRLLLLNVGFDSWPHIFDRVKHRRIWTKSQNLYAFIWCLKNHGFKPIILHIIHGKGDTTHYTHTMI